MIDHLDRTLTACAKGLEQMRTELHIAPPAIKVRVGAVWRGIGDRDRLDPSDVAKLGREERSEERRLKRQDTEAVG